MSEGLKFEFEGYEQVPSKQTMMSFLETSLRSPYIAVDTESDHEIGLFLGFSIAFSSMGMYFPVNHLEPGNIDRETYESAMEVIGKNDVRVFHNAAYDLRVLSKLGYDFRDRRFADTMLMAHFLEEELYSKDLDAVHKHFTGGVGKTRPEFMQDIIDTMGWRYVPIQLMFVYGSQDAVATAETYEVTKPRFEKEFGAMWSC